MLVVPQEPPTIQMALLVLAEALAVLAMPAALCKKISALVWLQQALLAAVELRRPVLPEALRSGCLLAPLAGLRRYPRTPLLVRNQTLPVRAVAAAVASTPLMRRATAATAAEFRLIQIRRLVALVARPPAALAALPRHTGGLGMAVVVAQAMPVVQAAMAATVLFPVAEVAVVVHQ